MKLLAFFMLLLTHTIARPPDSFTDCERYPNPADCHKWLRSIRGAQNDVDTTTDEGLDDQIDNLERTTTTATTTTAKDTKERDLVIAELVRQNQPHQVPFISFPSLPSDDLVVVETVKEPKKRRRRQPFPTVEADQKDLPEETVQID